MVPGDHHWPGVAGRPDGTERRTARCKTGPVNRHLFFLCCHQHHLPLCEKSAGASSDRWIVPCGRAGGCRSDPVYLEINSSLNKKRSAWLTFFFYGKAFIPLS